MTAAAKVGIVILFESELRKCAVLVEQFWTIHDNKDSQADAVSHAAFDALTACATALYGVNQEGHLLMLSARSLEDTAAPAAQDGDRG